MDIANHVRYTVKKEMNSLSYIPGVYDKKPCLGDVTMKTGKKHLLIRLFQKENKKQPNVKCLILTDIRLNYFKHIRRFK